MGGRAIAISSMKPKAARGTPIMLNVTAWSLVLSKTATRQQGKATTLTHKTMLRSSSLSTSLSHCRRLFSLPPSSTSPPPPPPPLPRPPTFSPPTPPPPPPLLSAQQTPASTARTTAKATPAVTATSTATATAAVTVSTDTTPTPTPTPTMFWTNRLFRFAIPISTIPVTKHPLFLKISLFLLPNALLCSLLPNFLLLLSPICPHEAMDLSPPECSALLSPPEFSTPPLPDLSS
uniref:Uncharacterized protein n=1 Tax=Fagus sylvatica TaxID=28930 RepID=A0A2N9ERR0_FAGSY